MKESGSIDFYYCKKYLHWLIKGTKTIKNQERTKAQTFLTTAKLLKHNINSKIKKWTLVYSGYSLLKKLKIAPKFINTVSTPVLFTYNILRLRS